MASHKKPLAVAVVGSGLAGLTAAYLLASPATRESGLEVEVHLFEKASALGMDSHSMSVTSGSKERRIDVPMRSFQGGYYKQLIALYRRLGVQFRRADFSYSFSSLTQNCKGLPDLRTYFIYNGSSGVKGVSPPFNGQTPQDITGALLSYMLFALSTFLVLFNYIRIGILSAPFLRPGPLVTFREWASRTTPNGTLARWMRLDASWHDFTQNILLPMFSAVCTAPEEDVYAHPVSEFLEYIWLTLGTHHYVVQHGVRDVVSRLTRGIKHIHLSSSIESIELDPSDTSTFSIKTSTETYSGFSHLILATQANNALPLLSSYHASLSQEPSDHRQAVEELIQCLEKFQYRKTVVVNHTDESFLPPHGRDRRDLNLVTQPSRPLDEKQEWEWETTLTTPASYTMATHVLRHSFTDRPLYQTTNPTVPPSQDHVLSVAVLERAVLTTESKRALCDLSVQDRGWWPFNDPPSALGRLQGAGRLQSTSQPGIWVCGSYAYGGIPLLEGCVASARDVVERGILRSEGVEVGDAPW